MFHQGMQMKKEIRVSLMKIKMKTEEVYSEANHKSVSESENSKIFVFGRQVAEYSKNLD